MTQRVGHAEHVAVSVITGRGHGAACVVEAGGRIGRDRLDLLTEAIIHVTRDVAKRVGRARLVAGKVVDIRVVGPAPWSLALGWITAISRPRKSYWYVVPLPSK